MSDEEFESRLNQEYHYWQAIEKARLKQRNRRAAEILPALLMVNIALWVIYWFGY